MKELQQPFTIEQFEEYMSQNKGLLETNKASNSHAFNLQLEIEELKQEIESLKKKLSEGKCNCRAEMAQRARDILEAEEFYQAELARTKDNAPA